MKDFLQKDIDMITPNPFLEQKIDAMLREKMTRKHAYLWRTSLFFGAVACAMVAIVLTAPSAHNEHLSLIAQAHAAYADLRTKLSEPGAVHHIATSVEFGEDEGIELTSEYWENADGTKTLFYADGEPERLALGEKIFIKPSTEEDGTHCATMDDGTQVCSVVVNGQEVAVGTSSIGEEPIVSEEPVVKIVSAHQEGEGENIQPPYIMVPQAGGGMIDEQYDPEDSSVLCVNWTPLTEEQEAARKTMEAVQEASNNLAAGTGSADEVITLLQSSANVEDRGMVNDARVGSLHMYRITYAPLGENTDNETIFTEFGISPETSMLRIMQEGSINASGDEHIDMTMRILVDEVFSAEEVPDDLFSPERIGFVEIARSSTEENYSFEDIPQYALHSGCYREGVYAPEWLSIQEEAAARARIEAAGADAPRMGGGGW